MKNGVLLAVAYSLGATMIVAGFIVGYFFNLLELFWGLFLGGVLVSIGTRAALGLIEGGQKVHRRYLSYAGLTISISSFVLTLSAYYLQLELLFEAALVVFFVSMLFLQKLRSSRYPPGRNR